MKRKEVSLLLSLLFVIFAVSPSSGAIGVSTLSIWVTVPAGETITGTLSFTNFQDEKMDLVIIPCDWKRLEGGEKLFLEPNSLDNSLAPYIKVTPEESSLGSGETRDFKYKISMPDKAEGTLWGAILAVPRHKITDLDVSGKVEKDKATIKDMNELAKHGFSVKIWAIEPSSAIPTGEINSLQFVRTGVNKSSHRFKIDFVNTGNVPLRPQGKLKILDAKSQKIAEYEMDKFGILPESTRIFYVPNSGFDPPEGKFTAEATFRFGDDKLVKKLTVFEVE